MKALMKTRHEPGLSLVEPPRVKNTDDGLFKVEYCAICVGETKVYNWNDWAAADSTIQLPTVLGHEASGVVIDVGSDVKHVLPLEAYAHGFDLVKRHESMKVLLKP